MTETIRTFVAVELPANVKEALAGVIDHLSTARVPGLRLVRPDGIHLTLKFLGNIPVSRVETITHTVDDAVVDHPCFVLTLGKTGVFPNINRPRVLWVGVEGEVESLRILYDLVEDSLTNIGFTSEKRGFNPHLTVGRIRREGTSVSDIQTVTDALSSAPLPPRSNIEVRSVSLIKSTLLPTGAVYETLATMPLRGESP